MRLSGTSMASPHVAGLVACVLSKELATDRPDDVIITDPTSPRYPATSIITEAIKSLQNNDDCTTAIAAKIRQNSTICKGTVNSQPVNSQK